MEFLHNFEINTFWPFVQSVYDSLGWLGVVIMMAVESCNIPLPSEIIMPLAGQFLVKSNTNWFGIFEAGLYGGIGCTIGSIISYYIGALGGRPIIEKYGKYILIRKHHLHTADVWFEKYGEIAAFFARLLPVIRTFISFPAGVARMNLIKFILYTFLGSFIWSGVLAWAGATWQPESIRNAMRPFDIPIVLIIVALIAWFVIRNWRNRKQSNSELVGESS